MQFIDRLIQSIIFIYGIKCSVRSLKTILVIKDEENKIKTCRVEWHNFLKLNCIVMLLYFASLQTRQVNRNFFDGKENF